MNKLMLAISVLLLLLGCSGPMPNIPTPKAFPNVAETVVAVLDTTKQAMPTVVPTASPFPTATTEPTPNWLSTIRAVVPMVISEPTALIPTTAPLPNLVPQPTDTPMLPPTHPPNVTRILVPTPTMTPSQMIDFVRPAIVRVETKTSTGSGVFIENQVDSGTALVLTNYHVIEDGMDLIDGVATVKVRVDDYAGYNGRIIGIDRDRDLALLEICCRSITALEFGNSDALHAGSEVITMGYSLGLAGAARSAKGIVSNMGYEKDVDRWVVQTDASLNPGDSGGPMLGPSGEILGINTYKFGGLFVEGIGVAIAEKTIRDQLDKLKDGGDFLESTHILEEWTFGPNPDVQQVQFMVDAWGEPWILEWTLEGGGTKLHISGRDMTGRFNDGNKADIVDVTTPGTGKVLFFSWGQFHLDFDGIGNYTVAIKTAPP